MEEVNSSSFSIPIFSVLNRTVGMPGKAKKTSSCLAIALQQAANFHPSVFLLQPLRPRSDRTLALAIPNKCGQVLTLFPLKKPAAC